MLTLALALASPANAFTTNGEAWSLDRAPVQVHWTGELTGFTHEQLAQTVSAVTNAWSAAAPCQFGYHVVEDPDAASWFDNGGDVAIQFGDPDGEMDEPGVSLVALPYPVSGGAFGGLIAAARTRIVVADAPDLWVPDAQIADEGCVPGHVSLGWVLAHELGYVAGLGNSCHPFEPCVGSDADAVMFWTSPACGVPFVGLGSDDIAGMQSLYDGVTLPYGCGSDPADPLGIACQVTTSDAESLAPTWSFQDGATASGTAVTHTFADAGYYTAELCVQSPLCGDSLCHTLAARTFESPDDGPGGYDVPKEPVSATGCATSPLGGPSWATLLLSAALFARRR